MAKSKSEKLNDSLDSYALNKAETLKNKFLKKKNELKESVAKEYGDKMYAPRDSGSYAKHTAINSRFDMDTIAPFKKNSFDTLKEMFESVYDFLKKEYHDTNKAVVKKQTVSIGIEFFADEDGDVIKVDLVPGRELNQDQYVKDKNLNLFINETYGDVTYIQTNIDAQIDNISGKNQERCAIKLLKVWKCSKSPTDLSYKKYKSFFIELLVIRAFDNGITADGLWDQLKAVLEYIRDNVKTVSLKDPGNSNNDLAKTLTADEKELLITRVKEILVDVERDEKYIDVYFPANPKYAVETNEYGKKGDGPTIITKTNRFG
jgi:hypothetical protein